MPGPFLDRCSGWPRGSRDTRFRGRQEPFALRLLTSQFLCAADCLLLFPGALGARLLVALALPHFAEDAFLLHLAFENA